MIDNSDFPTPRSLIIDRLETRFAELQRHASDRQRPIVTLTYAQSVDGCIAPVGGGTMQLSNPESHRLTHQLRALHDSILVGINTVLCDNPRLTVRLAPGESPQPIVLDSKLRFPLDADLLQAPCVRPMIVTGQQACSEKAERLTAAGARIVRVPLQSDGQIDLIQLFPIIKQLGYQSVMVEGGARVITNILTSGVADQLILAIAPRFVGGLRAVQPVEPGDTLPDLDDVEIQCLDGDLIIIGRLTTPARKLPESNQIATADLPDRVSD